MAKRRMINKEICRADPFCGMTVGAQALFYAMVLEADDRGYVNSALTIARSIGVGIEEIQILVKKKFILQRKKELYLIKPWRLMNKIQPTRFKETNYVEDFIKVYVDENEMYTVSKTKFSCQQFVDNLSTICQQYDDNLSTQ